MALSDLLKSSPRTIRKPVEREKGIELYEDPGKKIYRVMEYERFNVLDPMECQSFKRRLSEIDAGSIIKLEIFMNGVAHLIFLNEVIKVDRKEHDASLKVIEVEPKPQPSLFDKEIQNG